MYPASKCLAQMEVFWEKRIIRSICLSVNFSPKSRSHLSMYLGFTPGCGDTNSWYVMEIACFSGVRSKHSISKGVSCLLNADGGGNELMKWES